MSEFDLREFCERLAVVMKEAGFINPPRIVEVKKEQQEEEFIPLELELCEEVHDFPYDDHDQSFWFE